MLLNVCQEYFSRGIPQELYSRLIRMGVSPSLIKQYAVGRYQEVRSPLNASSLPHSKDHTHSPPLQSPAAESAAGAESFLLDLERCLSFLLGLHAGNLTLSLPITEKEAACEEWLKSGILAGGLEREAYLTTPDSDQREKGWKLDEAALADSPLREKVEKSPEAPPSDYMKQTSHEPSLGLRARDFIRKLVNNDQSDAIVQSFFAAVRHHCHTHMWVTGTEGKPYHPVEDFARHYMAALLKHGDLIQVAMDIENRAVVDREQESAGPPSMQGRLPSPLVDMCKIVHDGKLKLMKVCGCGVWSGEPVGVGHSVQLVSCAVPSCRYRSSMSLHARTMSSVVQQSNAVPSSLTRCHLRGWTSFPSCASGRWMDSDQSGNAWQGISFSGAE